MSDTPGDTTRSPRALSGILIVVLALLTAVAPLATDMYLPAFPAMAGELGTTAAGVQLTLTAFLLGLGIGQLFIGALSDTVGRRRPILIGSLVCLVAGIGCALAPNIGVLVVARFVQGLGGAAGVVLARAIISDSAKGAVAAKLQGALIIISVIAPVAAPLAGGTIIANFGWRPVFWVLAALTLVMVLGTLTHVRETLPESARTGDGLTAMLGGARAVLTNRGYAGYLLTFCFSFAGLFAYISASPFVIQNVMGMSTSAYTIVFSFNALLVLITSSVASALAGRVAYRSMITAGLTAAVLASAVLVVAVFGGVPTVPVLVSFACFQGALGFVLSNTTVLALAEAGCHAGTGSAFLGCLQFVLAAAVSPLVGIMGEDTAVPMGIAVIVSILLAVLAFSVLTSGKPASRDASAEHETAGAS
ncbi:Bcr/CflA family drug resistance efflux transporter [Actinopolyspora erythraea]|uniref:Bcr/CflA family drug resistance efflux transporter n=1 Tax=Actinopolyspora erythraea TaxID=414996 RepID=A0A223RS92_9ACTN|nr:multidrug effflux MFS transporter [Actinopolyspora erythraea]ASU78704.1 Bcr/CflA family drug resistance efflux transporter [Actinopolyspora erythraea]